MAIPTNLNERAAEQLATWQTEKGATQLAVQVAQTASVTNQQVLQAAIDAHAELTKGITSIRAALALIETPADAAPLLVQLQTALIAQHASAGAIVAAEAAVAR